MAKQKIERITIIQKTLTLFRAQGYHNTSMSDIASACNMSKAGLYHHFSSKVQLAKVALSWLQQHFNENVLQIKQKETLLPREQLCMILDATEHFLLDTIPQGGCIIANIALETSGEVKEFASVIKNYFDNWISHYQQLFEHIVPRAQAKVLAESIISQTHGALLLAQIYGDNAYLKRVGQNTLQYWDNQAQKAKKAQPALA